MKPWRRIANEFRAWLIIPQLPPYDVDLPDEPAGRPSLSVVPDGDCGLGSDPLADPAVAWDAPSVHPGGSFKSSDTFGWPPPLTLVTCWPPPLTPVTSLPLPDPARALTEADVRRVFREELAFTSLPEHLAAASEAIQLWSKGEVCLDPEFWDRYARKLLRLSIAINQPK